MNGGAWQAKVHGVAKSQTQLNNLHTQHKAISQFSSVQSLSRVQLFMTWWTTTHQVPLSVEFSRQEYWSGLPFPSPGNLPDPGIRLRYASLQADSLLSEPPGKLIY